MHIKIRKSVEVQKQCMKSVEWVWSRDSPYTVTLPFLRYPVPA